MKSRPENSRYFLPFTVDFADDSTRDIANNYIAQRIEEFLQKKEKEFAGIQPSRLENFIFSWEFSDVEFSYFYKYLFNDLLENPHQLSPKYVVTFDKECEGKEIKLYKKTVLYYVYIDLQKMFDHVRAARVLKGKNNPKNEVWR